MKIKLKNGVVISVYSDNDNPELRVEAKINRYRSLILPVPLNQRQYLQMDLRSAWQFEKKLRLKETDGFIVDMRNSTLDTLTSLNFLNAIIITLTENQQ